MSNLLIGLNYAIHTHMIDRIVILDMYNAIVVYTNRPPLKLYHSDAMVLDMVAYMLAPICNINTMSQFITSQLDTISINIGDYK